MSLNCAYLLSYYNVCYKIMLVIRILTVTRILHYNLRHLADDTLTKRLTNTNDKNIYVYDALFLPLYLFVRR